MATKKTKQTVQTRPKIVKSKRKTSLDEFALVKGLREEEKAGFKAWLKGEYFHFDKEWKELFIKYKNRTISK